MLWDFLAINHTLTILTILAVLDLILSLIVSLVLAPDPTLAYYLALALFPPPLFLVVTLVDIHLKRSHGESRGA